MRAKKMSKLAKAIDAAFTGDVKLARNLKSNYLSVEKISQPVHDPMFFEERIGIMLRAKLETKAYISPFAADPSNIHSYTEALRDLKKAMIEEVFGEFRPMIIEMRAALYGEDTSRIRRLLAEMEQSMFADGL
jgi:hypothetical protein